MDKLFLIISTCCRDCGNDTTVKLQTTKPTDEEQAAVAAELGGMFCIRTNVAEIELGKIVTVDNE